MARVSITDLKTMKQHGEKIVMLTAYDYPSARIVDAAGVPVILVGDSLGMVVLGYDSTLPVTMEEMLHHVKAVARGAQHAHIVADMPFMSYQASAEAAMRNAGRFLQEGGAQSVKLEGGEHVAEMVRRLVQAGIPVMGHLGLTPQSVNQFGGYKVQGKTPAAAVKLLQDALALEQAGAYAIVLETIPAPLARIVTERLSVPTIGIGAGPDCDGQVQVFHDLLGLYPDFTPKHAKRYANLAEAITGAVQSYAEEVRSGSFPDDEHSFQVDEAFFADLLSSSHLP
ncbi:MAG TPA: 3-methyl-2-oxobutanoate hydroxymethyltransferase [Dehalococcoidia bacterium]|nr:3-methyl-2-oxobutanoate hydroxymethyltransferase [Dehalococcoidia bacterium]